MNKLLEPADYKLKPIGGLLLMNGFVTAYVYPEYKPALKSLDLFSHVILIFEKGENGLRKASNELDNYDLQKLYQIRKLNVEVCKILRLDVKKGILIIDHLPNGNGKVIYDIKPYFPCEDRVKNYMLPKNMPKHKEWRTDVISQALQENQEFDMTFPDIVCDEFSVRSIGEMGKTEAKCVIKLQLSKKEILNTLMEFSHIKVLWWFHRFDKKEYRHITQVNPPYENAPRTGVFATRSPVRPNPIALTTARIININYEEGSIQISDTDSFDGSPVIDILPYVPEDDRGSDCSVPYWLQHWPEWLDDREESSVQVTLNTLEADFSKLSKYLIPDKSQKDSALPSYQNEIQVIQDSNDDIIITGARQNNLKNISCRIPKNKMTVITGVSGSGKSSLAFDIIVTESQRRFMDSMSAAGRLIFDQMEKPEVDQIIGLPPAVAIQQSVSYRNPRSTVGTMTDIYDYLKLLYSIIGIRHCPECGHPVKAYKTQELIDILGRLNPGTLLKLRSFHKDEVCREFIVPDISKDNSFYINQLKDSVHKALSEGNGAMEVELEGCETFILQTKEMCYHCNRVFFSMTASMFSFNNPESICPVCKGLGVKLEVDPELIVSNPDRSILDEASLFWGNLRKHRLKPNANWMKGEVLALAKELDVDLELPWNSLPEVFKKQAIYGSEGKEVRFIYENSNGRKGEIIRPVEGAYHILSRLFRENSGDTAGKIAASFMRESKCNSCQGERLSPEGRMITIGGTRYPEAAAMTIEELRNWVIGLPNYLSKEEALIADHILREMLRKLNNLIDAGIAYLSLDRPAPTLSGGEAQRLRLATQLGSGISNILYVLDEPAMGLHFKDHERLIKIMKKLKNEGNTVIVVEHNGDIMLAADKIIDIGPGAGTHGGEIIFEGTPERILQNNQSETGKYLRNLLMKQSDYTLRRRTPVDWLRIKGAKHNNLKNIDVSIPLGIFTCITGVSGSGKSTLISKILYPALSRYLYHSDTCIGQYDSIEGMEKINHIISISQQPIGRTPRSNPATYTGVFDDIRDFYASLDEAKHKGYKQNKFSFNSKEGQCEVCSGEGRKCVPMHFMPDVWIECTSCNGKRYNKEALEIVYEGKTIADILDLNAEEALSFFKTNIRIFKVLQTICDVGLGYIKLGQSALTLSGGEAQRIKLAKELSKRSTGNTIYLLDEPTTGLHFSDVMNLLKIIRQITETGNTVIVIEHNLEMIKSADWIIDLGPDGGKEGGYLVAQGVPEEIALVQESHTGQALQRFGF